MDTLDKENTAVSAGSPDSTGAGYLNTNVDSKALADSEQPKDTKNFKCHNILYSKPMYLMKAMGFVENIESLTNQNDDFRRVIYTGKHTQLVLMKLLPGEEIGSEVHENIDQFFRVDSGVGMVVIDGKKHRIADGAGIVVPAGSEHNVINISKDQDLKLYTLYSPPEHKDGTIRHTKQEAESQKEEFDGKTSENLNSPKSIASHNDRPERPAR